ncbi:MAG: hypothetical protein N2322_05035, partial [Terrimicrobiaceae bacterium]|nr:hypothetical protein [Terrimicrobiaceae bacterium]
MLKPACPKCRQEIPPADVNPSADVAFCRRCNLAARLSDLVAEGPSAPFDAAHPPRGVAVEGGPGGVVMRASHRSLAAAVGLLAMALFWNGITSV